MRPLSFRNRVRDLFQAPLIQAGVKRAPRLSMESLEDRTTPATITVTTLNDVVAVDGVVSLREAINSINAAANTSDVTATGAYGTDDTILFDASLTGGTSTLASVLPTIAKAVQITGPTTGTITLDANNASQHFIVDDGTGTVINVGISGLTLTNGQNSASAGGSIANVENLTLNNVIFTNNKTTGAFSGGAISNSGASAVLSITGGSFTGNQSGFDSGAVDNLLGTVSITGTTFSGNSAANFGGVLASNGTVTLSGVTVTNNTALAGGGVWNAATGTLTITDAAGNVLFDGNVATGDVGTSPNFADLQGGGAIYNAGDGLGAGGTLNLLDQSDTNTFTISNNKATGATKGSGGGLLTVGGTTSIAGVTFTSNEAVRAGGAIEAVSGTLNIDDSAFGTNDVSDTKGVVLTAAPGNGGAIHITNAVTTTITNSTFTSNFAKNEGGAIWNSGTGTMSISSTTIDGNGAKLGGGVFQDDAAPGTINISASTISNNQAAMTGGGVLVQNGTVTITNSTISGNNSQGAGGGIALELTGTASLVNATVAKNTATTSGGGVDVPATATLNTVSSIIALNTGVTGPDVNGIATSTGNNLFGNDAGLTIMGGSADQKNVDPLLGPLANNGGPTQTHALLAGSPALNTGSNTASLTTDQRGTGFVRVFGTAADIGAFEAQPFTSKTVLTVDPSATGRNQPVTLTATVTVPGGVAMPSGSVTFTNTTTGEVLGTVDLVDGVATLVVTTLPAGVNDITAQYSGDLNALQSTSDPASVTIAASFANGASYGTGAGGGTAILTGTDGKTLLTATPFGAEFTGGIRVATGDFNGDGVADLVVGNGPGIASKVVILNGKDGTELFSVAPFEASFTGGVYVAVGDINQDGVPELVITPDQGGGPRVQVYDGASIAAGSGKKIADFFGITDPDFRGGARAGVADIDGDGYGDLIVSAGFQGGPRVAVWNGTSIAEGSSPTKLIDDIFVFEDTLRNGAFVTGADIDGDGKADLIAGAGPGGSPRIVAFNGADLLDGKQTQMASFFAGNPDNRNGVPVAVTDFDGDGTPDLLTGTGEPMTPATASPSTATVYKVSELSNASPTPLDTVDPFPGFTGGVFVG